MSHPLQLPFLTVSAQLGSMTPSISVVWLWLLRLCRRLHLRASLLAGLVCRGSRQLSWRRLFSLCRIRLVLFWGLYWILSIKSWYHSRFSFLYLLFCYYSFKPSPVSLTPVSSRFVTGFQVFLHSVLRYLWHLRSAFFRSFWWPFNCLFLGQSMLCAGHHTYHPDPCSQPFSDSKVYQTMHHTCLHSLTMNFPPSS